MSIQWISYGNRYVAKYGLYEINTWTENENTHPIYSVYKQAPVRSVLGKYPTLDDAKAACETDLVTTLDSYLQVAIQKDTDMSKDTYGHIHAAGQKGIGMSKDETIHTSPTGAQKAGNLERHDLIPTGPLRQLARHYGVGAQKYDDNNWQLGYDWSLSYAALQRHITAFWQGQDIDEETGSPHTIAAAWHALALTWFMTNKPEYDDRPKNDPPN